MSQKCSLPPDAHARRDMHAALLLESPHTVSGAKRELPLPELLSKIGDCVEPLEFQSENEKVFVRQCSNRMTNRITVPIDVPGTRAGFS